jgi:hypothetical protein
MIDGHDCGEGVSNHSFGSEDFSGTEYLGPCLICGLSASHALNALAHERDCAVTRLKETLIVLDRLKNLSIEDEVSVMDLKFSIQECI